MPLKLAHRMENLGTETAFEVLAKARKLEAQGKNIVHLEIGEPDFPTPPNIVEAAQKAIRDGFTHYTPAGGLMPARQAVADWIRRTYEVDVQPEQVVMVPGSKNVLLFTILALIDEGTEAIVPDPGYPIYESLVTMAGGKAVPIALRERNDFRHRDQRAPQPDRRRAVAQGPGSDRRAGPASRPLRALRRGLRADHL